MKKTQLLITALCASALVLGGCGTKSSKKKKTSSEVTTSSQQEKVLSSIAITKAPDKVSYYGGESFDPTGMVVTASYSDGTTADVTSQCTFAPEKMSGSVTSVTVSFGGKTASQAVSVTDWSATQKALFAQYLHGFEEVPYYPVQGSSLFRDSDNACVSYGGGASSASILETYASLFDSSWNMEKMPDDYIPYYGLSYSGEKTFSVDGEEITVEVSLYGWDSVNGYVSEDGTGTFYMDLSDGFYYSWEEFEYDYNEVLSYFYDEYDESGYPVDFPAADVINYEGELDYIEVEEDWSDDESELIYYSVGVAGVSATDLAAFIGAFNASPSWVSYTDTLNEVEAFYHVSEKLCIGYFYNATAETLIFFIHSFFWTEWPAGKVSSYIAEVNNVTDVVVPALELESAIYIVEADSSSMGVFIMPQDEPTLALIESYKGLFDTNKWVVEKIIEVEDDPETEESEEVYYYSCQSKDHAVDVQFGLQAYSDAPNQHYISVIVLARTPLVSTFPATEALAFYTAHDIEVASIPSFSIAATTGGFCNEVTPDYVGSVGFEATDDELEAFLSGFAAPWAFDSANSDLEKGEYVFNYGDSLASCNVYDVREEAGYHFVEVDFVIRDWTTAQKESFAAHLDGIVPPFIPYFSDLAWSDSYGVFTNGLVIPGDYKDDIVALLDGWTLVDTKDESTAEQNPGFYYYYGKDSAHGSAIITIHVYYYSADYPDVTGLTISFKQTAWFADEVAAFESKLGGVVPPFLGEIDASDQSHTFVGYDLYEPEELAAFDALFTTDDGWTKTGEGVEAVFSKAATGGTVKVSFVEYEYWGTATGSYYWVIDFVASQAA